LEVTLVDAVAIANANGNAISPLDPGRGLYDGSD
jgi:hypothetical protein